MVKKLAIQEITHKHFCAFAVLATLFIAETMIVQSLSFEFKLQRLLVTVSMTGILFCLPRWTIRIAAVLQTIFSLYIIHYVYYLTESPTMSSLTNGSHLLIQSGWDISGYILWLPTCICLLLLVSKIAVISHTPVLQARYSYATGAVFLWLLA